MSYFAGIKRVSDCYSFLSLDEFTKLIHENKDVYQECRELSENKSSSKEINGVMYSYFRLEKYPSCDMCFVMTALANERFDVEKHLYYIDLETLSIKLSNLKL